MAKYYVSYTAAPHIIHRDGCPDMVRETCVFIGDFYTLKLAASVAKHLLFEDARECGRCIERSAAFVIPAGADE